MGRKAYATRVDFEMDGILNTDTYYTMEGYVTSLGRSGRPGLAGAAGKDTSLTSWKENISVSKRYAGHKIALAFTGITTFRRASIITRKQANALAAVTASACCRGANRETRPFCYGRILYWRCCRLTQARQFRGFNGQ
jgi:hypothetical protein